MPAGVSKVPSCGESIKLVGDGNKVGKQGGEWKREGKGKGNKGGKLKKKRLDFFSIS